MHNSSIDPVNQPDEGKNGTGIQLGRVTGVSAVAVQTLYSEDCHLEKEKPFWKQQS